MNNAHLLNNVQGQQPMMNLAMPFNDAQLIGMIASQYQELEAADAVDKAVEVLAHSVGAVPRLIKRITELRDAN